MPKSLAPPSLILSPSRNSNVGLQGLSPSLSPATPGSPHTPRSIPGSPFLNKAPTSSMLEQANTGTDVAHGPYTHNTNDPSSPQLMAMETPPSDGRTSPKHGRDPSKSFFSNFMASKSSHRLHSPDMSISETGEKPSMKSRASSKDRSLNPLRGRRSTPDLPKSTPVNESAIDDSADDGTGFSSPQIPNDHSNAAPWSNKKGRSKLGGILGRTKSIKLDDGVKLKPRSPSQLNLDPQMLQSLKNDPQLVEPVKPTISNPDYREKAFASENGSITRNRSADRQQAAGNDANFSMPRPYKYSVSAAGSHSFRDGATSHLLSNIHQTGRGVGDRLGKAGKGIFGKITRSGSNNEREAHNDDNYTCTVINLPLVKQTRKTRIARRLERSKDKTEYWMPALPWRCIDYLNMNGCEEEGLYRIPGSGKDVKHWQRRFDSEYDIDLLEEPELYDINTIGSMFKAWLRELPDEILPKAVQLKIAQECAGATQTPKLLKDELSKLPPFNYYLLFAITCHLSLLHSFSEKNKMDYRNLCICFQPCLKIDGFCFQFLVQDWKSCWQGCWTEKQFLEEELRYEREGSVTGSDHSADERAISSSGSSQYHPIAADATTPQRRKSSLPRTVQRRASAAANSQTNAHLKENSTPIPAMPKLSKTSDPHVNNDNQLPELRSLSPIKM